MRWSALLIVKGSRRQARCQQCRAVVTWATLARKGGKSIPLVAMPIVLRDEHGENGVVAEVVGFDQIHKCPTRRPTPRPHSTPGHATSDQPAAPAFATFTPERMAQLRAQLAPKPKPPQPHGLG
jgi:hypothetical protein